MWCAKGNRQISRRKQNAAIRLLKERIVAFVIREFYMYPARGMVSLSPPRHCPAVPAQARCSVPKANSGKDLHTPLQESSKTADDGASAPREWCGCSGCMVHSGRRHGAHGRRAFPLFGNTFALAHGFTLDLDGVGVVDDPITDGVGQGGVVQVLVPLAGVVLGAEDGGGHLAPGLY